MADPAVAKERSRCDRALISAIPEEVEVSLKYLQSLYRPEHTCPLGVDTESDVALVRWILVRSLDVIQNQVVLFRKFGILSIVAAKNSSRSRAKLFHHMKIWMAAWRRRDGQAYRFVRISELVF